MPAARISHQSCQRAPQAQGGKCGLGFGWTVPLSEHTVLFEAVAELRFILLLPHRCNSGNLNGHYYDGPLKAMTDDGVVWYTWHGWTYSIKSVVMMIRASDLEPPPAEIYLPEGHLEPSGGSRRPVRPS